MRKTTITLDLKTGETRTDHDGVVYSGMDGFIKSQLDMLKGFRDNGREPNKDLLDDIAAYEFMLKNGSVDEYMDWKDGDWEKRPRHFPSFIASSERAK